MIEKNYNSNYKILFDRVLNLIELDNYKGHDPYDGSNNLFSLHYPNLNKINLLIQQSIKYFPTNIRPILGVAKGYNAKALGLILSSLTRIYCITKDESLLEKCEHIIKILLKIRAKSDNLCWGYNFDWYGLDFRLPKNEPSAVVTATVVKGLYSYYSVTKKRSIISLINSSCDFVLKDLKVTKKEESQCFSYTPFVINQVHNANLLASEILLIGFELTGKSSYKDNAYLSFNFTLESQNSDGSWDYSIIGQETRKQIDWHQGFILDSLVLYDEILGLSKNAKKKLLKGAEFYKNNQFVDNQFGFWRYPKLFPIDIHNQSQGIITFSKLARYDLSYLDSAASILEWTIINFYDRRGFFYYQKNRFFINKSNFIRWNQAWMLLALSIYLHSIKYHK